VTTIDNITTFTPATYPTIDGGESTYFTNQFRKIAQAFVSLRQILDAASLGVTKKAGVPTTASIPVGTSMVFKDTTGGGVYLAYNDAGTIKKVALT
jgi:hypothetical protein